MSAADELARALAGRDVDVADLVRRAEADARAEAEDVLRGLLREDILRRGVAQLTQTDVVALVGIADGVEPLVLQLRSTDLDDEAALERAVRDHSELLLGALRGGAVLPFRFGTTFPTRAALDDWVSLHRAALAAELERLRGTTEWSVELLGEVDEEPARYLESRLATAVRPDVRARLAAVSIEQRGDAYLVAADGRDAFAAALADLEAEGYELRTTGPWPPYSFARLP
jgi:Gas vesicle synthesis protein GvpL/GvpF